MLSMITIRKAYHWYESGGVKIDCNNIVLDWQGCATLMAPSGSGKTTLFRLIAGWFAARPQSRCEFEGKVCQFRHIRFVGGHESLLSWKTVEQNYKFFDCHSVNPDLSESLSAVGLPVGVRSLYPYQLSLGMYKRVELILAVLSRPKLLLLDEFFSSIDTRSKTLCRAFLKINALESMVWVTAHEEDLAEWIGERSYEFIMNGSGPCISGIRMR